MKIQIGVTKKMKLYNVYRLCKLNIELIDDLNISHNQNTDIYTINNWLDLKNILNKIEKIPALKISTNKCIESVPDVVRHEESPRMNKDTYNKFIDKKNILYNKMNMIIELYESMNLENDGNGVDIKLPPCEDLKEYISYLKDLEFIFSQCPYLQCENEILKFGSVDIGSNWIKLTIAGASTCLLLTNVASLVDKAMVLRSHYITISQQEELLKSQQIKNELAEENFETFKTLKNTYMNIIINQLQKEYDASWNPEDIDKAERSLEKLIILLDKGCEIYATLDAPEDVQALFPEIQGNLELPDNIMKYLEDKEGQDE